MLLLVLLAIAFAHVQLYCQASGVLLLLGSCFAHLYISLFPICLLHHAGELRSQRRNKKFWGLFSCSAVSILLSIAILGVLALHGLYAKFLVGFFRPPSSLANLFFKVALTSMLVSLTPWTILHVYKTRRADTANDLPEGLNSDVIGIPSVVESDSIVESYLQVDDNGLVHRISSSGHDSCITFDKGDGSAQSSCSAV